MQYEPQQPQIGGVPTVIQSDPAGNVQQFSPASIERWKAKYTDIPTPRRVSGGLDSRTIQTLIIATASAIALPATAFIIASSVPSAQNERMVHHLLQQNAQLASEQRKVCILAYCPPDNKPEPATVPLTPTPMPTPQYVEQPSSGWFEESSSSTVVLADGTVVNVPVVGGY